MLNSSKGAISLEIWIHFLSYVYGTHIQKLYFAPKRAEYRTSSFRNNTAHHHFHALDVIINTVRAHWRSFTPCINGGDKRISPVHLFVCPSVGLCSHCWTVWYKEPAVLCHRMTLVKRKDYEIHDAGGAWTLAHFFSI